jgi:hypothetical protein
VFTTGAEWVWKKEKWFNGGKREAAGYYDCLRNEHLLELIRLDRTGDQVMN